MDTKSKKRKNIKQKKLKQLFLVLSIVTIAVVIAALSITSGCDQKDIDVLNPDDTTLPTVTPSTSNGENIHPKPTLPVPSDEPVRITADNYMDDPNGLLARGEYSKKIFDDGSINVLITGEDRLALTDTIGIISVNKSEDKIKLVMIPRDMLLNITTV